MKNGSSSTSSLLATTGLALAGAVAAALSLSPAQAQDGAKERCYGISQAGKNDCAAAGNNSCAGTAKSDFDKKAWKYVAKGTCSTMEITLKDGNKRKGSLEAL
jgi:uncharacterized membrane protein